MSKRKHHSRRTTGERYALLPLEVFLSPACATLPHFAVRLLLAIAAQYNGLNNGDLAMTWDICQKFGIRSKEHLTDGLALLIERGLIVKTIQGGKNPRPPCLYAVTWRPINERAGGYDFDIVPTSTAANNWTTWAPSHGMEGRPVKRSRMKDFPHEKIGPNGKFTGRRGDCDGTEGSPVTGLESGISDQKRQVHGTEGRPPSENLPVMSPVTGGVQ